MPNGGFGKYRVEIEITLLPGERQEFIRSLENLTWSEGEEHVKTSIFEERPEAGHMMWFAMWTSRHVRIKSNFHRPYETFPDKTFIACTPVTPDVNDDEKHIRVVLASNRPYKNEVDNRLLAYHPYGESKYCFLGRVNMSTDFPSLPSETSFRRRAIMAAAFGRCEPRTQPVPVRTKE